MNTLETVPQSYESDEHDVAPQYRHSNGQECFGCQICWGNELEREQTVKPVLDPRARVCVQCSLPSHRGLPSFKSMRDITGQHLYYHETCPADPEQIIAEIIFIEEERLERDAKARSLTRFRKPQLRGAPWKH